MTTTTTARPAPCSNCGQNCSRSPEVCRYVGETIRRAFATGVQR